MLFIIFAVLLVLGVIGYIVCERYGFYSDVPTIASGFIMILSSIAVTISLLVIIANYCSIDGDIARDMQRYESLVYQLENDIYDNDNDIGKRELMVEIQEWNESLAANKANQSNFWIGIYIPDIYDNFEFIELKGEKS